MPNAKKQIVGGARNQIFSLGPKNFSLYQLASTECVFCSVSFVQFSLLLSLNLRNITSSLELCHGSYSA